MDVKEQENNQEEPQPLTDEEFAKYEKKEQTLWSYLSVPG